MTYNPYSMKAEEFISDAEILDTLAYAEANKKPLRQNAENLQPGQLPYE